jgi:UV DNA damage repair endonuclease
MEDKRTKFLRVYANVPDNLREDIIVIVDDKTYTWNTAYFEIKNNTELGRKLLKELIITKLI